MNNRSITMRKSRNQDPTNAHSGEPGRLHSLMGDDADLSWRLLQILNGYRVTASLILLALFFGVADLNLVGGKDPLTFLTAAVGLGLLGAINAGFVYRRWPGLGTQAAVQTLIDVTCITIIAHTSGGVDSGLANLLMVTVGGAALVLRRRGALLAAAISTLAVLAQQALILAQGAASSSSFVSAGLLGILLFLVALAAQPLAVRLRASEALARQRGFDLANLSQLNHYIIQNLRESILVLDEDESIRLVNNSAARLLGLPDTSSRAHLSLVSLELLDLVRRWRKRGGNESHSEQFMASDNATLINAHFAAIDNPQTGALLIFLEDASLFAEKVQQSKLASLGRLSASIAHEIRNPVGAMSHAGQLLAESPALGPDERRLTEIIHTNANRISSIVENVLQLSRRDKTTPERLNLEDWLGEFAGAFAKEMQLSGDWMKIPAVSSPTEILMDPSHLEQVLWNLCENALKYGASEDGRVQLKIRTGRVPNSGRPFLEIQDSGPGVPEAAREQLFEPFFTAGQEGTGLGLFICRELCECNRATLIYLPAIDGGSIFRIIFTDPQRWDKQEQ
jgi:two-component system sensor histidine kinase PilS (NtrC family)